jgi:(p)ppGpp synthase/HD superfamily hydrolase
VWHYAQTILQLYSQLERLQWSEADVSLVRRAYGLAAVLFSGQYAGSGKPHLCHDVGTASVLASMGTSSATVAAGLLHNAYYNGDFGDGTRGVTAARRAEIVSAVGVEVEERIGRFATLVWTVDGVERLRDSLAQLDAVTKDAVLLRLADHVDHHSDRGIAYRRDRREQRSFDRGATPLLVEIASYLGYGELSELIKRQEEAGAALPLAIGTDIHVPSGVIAPRSFRRRLLLRFSLLVRGWRRLAHELRNRSAPLSARRGADKRTARGPV